jgi:sarcosine oxidase gamma subunit
VLRRPAERELFELHVNGSLAPYVWLFLENAAREFGFTIAA